MKTILAATTAIMLATTANASQTWEYAAHGDWVVELVQLDYGPMACVTSNRNLEEGFAFSIWDYNDGFYDLQIFDSTFAFNNTEGTIDFVIDNNPMWTADAVFFEQSIISRGLADNDLIAELMSGRTLYILDMRGEWTHWFSLNGSRDAIMSMIECAQQIDNGPVYNESNGPVYNEQL